MAADFGVGWAFFEPELLTLDPTTLDSWIAVDARPQGLQLLPARRAAAQGAHAHAREEALLARRQPAGRRRRQHLQHFPQRRPALADGQAGGRQDSAASTPSGFSAARAVREPRRPAEGRWRRSSARSGSYRRTLGATLSTAVQAALFQTRARNYESTLQRALDGPNIPPSVYTALVDGVNAHLPAFHRYLKLRQRILRRARAALLRPLRAAGRGRAARIHRRAGAGGGESGDRAARRRLRAGARSRLQGPLDRLLPDAGQAVGRLHGPATPTTCIRTCCSTTTASTTDMSALAHELGHAMHS